MTWIYNKNYVSRAELGIMAILANNNWKRPIYFANMLSSENFIGLDKYLVNEGLVYRLMPVEAEQPDAQISLVNVDTLYKNISQKYQWGNIAGMNHFDHDYRSFVNSYLFGETFNVALDTLIREGRMEEGRLVAVLAYENMPKKIVSGEHVFNNTVVVDTLFKTDEKNRAFALADKSLTYIDDQLNYYHALGNNLSAFDIRDMRLVVASLENYRKIVHEVGDEQLIARIKKLTVRYD
jgi:hypothetical protein